ncbi:ABC transporter permease [Streptomyces sp. SID13588]|uniref:ABC transporter permease n=1 Tax=Streptomyces sp. SID13588 TaxID=2706051 RepID=UPI0013CD5BAC|nr:ABC transporter permease [Streptomyces sp. SID13588]NEA71439.1 ABC transporter permease [Streptomyces sp. SID13588]
MSTMTSTAVTPPARMTDPAVRFVDLLAAEWIKMRSLRSTYWVLVVSALVAIAVNLNAVHTDLTYIDQSARPGMPPYRYDPLFHGLNSIAVYLMMLAAASVGAISIFGEYATGMVRTTFAAVPDRRAVVAAKVVVVTAVTLVMGVIISTASFFGTNAMLASRHVGLSINDPGCLRAVTAYALIVPVSALIGIAFAAVIRHATATIVGLVSLLFIAPLMFGGDRYKLLKEIGHCLPIAAVDRLKQNPDNPYFDPGKYPATITGSWIALGCWALVSVVVAIVVVRRRDV